MAPMMPGAPAAAGGDTLLDKGRPVLGADWMELARMNAKKVVGILLVLFLGFWMFQDPHGFAQTAKDARRRHLDRADRSSSAA